MALLWGSIEEMLDIPAGNRHRYRHCCLVGFDDATGAVYMAAGDTPDIERRRVAMAARDGVEPVPGPPLDGFDAEGHPYLPTAWLAVAVHGGRRTLDFVDRAAWRAFGWRPEGGA